MWCARNYDYLFKCLLVITNDELRNIFLTHWVVLGAMQIICRVLDTNSSGLTDHDVSSCFTLVGGMRSSEHHSWHHNTLRIDISITDKDY